MYVEPSARTTSWGNCGTKGLGSVRGRCFQTWVRPYGEEETCLRPTVLEECFIIEEDEAAFFEKNDIVECVQSRRRVSIRCFSLCDTADALPTWLMSKFGSKEIYPVSHLLLWNGSGSSLSTPRRPK